MNVSIDEVVQHKITDTGDHCGIETFHERD
jgi:hypothetical protein